MNILLWVLQGLTALLFAMSGVMKVFMFDKVSKDVPSFGALPRGVWTALGIVDRGGRPYLLPLRPASPAAFLDLLHRAIDRDAEAALTTTGGARLDPGGEPELVGICELVPAARD